MELGNETRVEPSLPRATKWAAKSMGRGPTLAIPPAPPAKDLPELPAQSRLGSWSPVVYSTPPPNRPLPPRPMVKPADSPKPPQPARPAPLRPQGPLSMNPPTRPGTASSSQVSGSTTTTRFPFPSKRLSWASNASRRPIKYGQGRYGRVELVPQPSDDPDDPLNWPTWKKELNFWSLLLMVAITGVTKTIFVTAGSQLTESYRASYTAVAAVTGVPLILSALSGFLCLVASRICGKRPLYVASLLLVFIGTVWNTNVASSYAQCMAARVFQGLGWGAFDTLVLASIQDTYFEHERGRPIAIYSIVAVATTWGAPLIGGVTSEGQAGFSLQFTILSAFFVVAVPAVTLGAPETAFDRAFTVAQTPSTTTSDYKFSVPLTPSRLFSSANLTNYITKLKPCAYSSTADLSTLLQAPRALITPTTALLAAVSLLPHAALWGLTTSLSLLFSPLPFVLSPKAIGLLFLAPFLLSTAAVAAPALTPRWRTRFTAKSHMAAVLATGSALALTGILTFGLHLASAMTPTSTAQPESVTPPAHAPDNLHLAQRAAANLPAASFALGLLAASASLLDAALAAPLVRASTAFTAPSLAVATRNTADMLAALACWRALAAGASVVAAPAVVTRWDGLRGFCVGVGAAQVGVAVAAGAVWWVWGEVVRGGDGRVMGLVGLNLDLDLDLRGERKKKMGGGGWGGEISFFDMD
ncbi:MFS general substrate transporter [Parathielavia hyrcaniae]|uniref:MFS general substrate transporter n=1 Tax=Parathielavia hyrcaniae TaxID=113614 RepID=A0AAN6Q5R6_9PEZI|nr:MFS general substrate transporter [Parathielavia hyrcaniae]